MAPDSNFSRILHFPLFPPFDFHNSHNCRNNFTCCPECKRTAWVFITVKTAVNISKALLPTEWWNGCCFMFTLHLFDMFKPSPKCAHVVYSSSWTWFHSTACICMVCGVCQVLLGKLLTPDTCVAVESGQIHTRKEFPFGVHTAHFLTFWAFCSWACF